MMGCRNEEVYALIAQQTKPLVQEQLQLLMAQASGEEKGAVAAGSAYSVNHVGGDADSATEDADSATEDAQTGPASGRHSNDGFDSKTFNFMHASSLCYGLAKAG